MKKAKNFLKKHDKLKSYWSDESRLTQKILIECLNTLESMNGKKEEEDSIPQVAGVQRFECTTCKTAGYTEEWREEDEKTTQKIIRDCTSCKGEGFIIVDVVDKRKKSKNRKLEFNDEY